MLENTLFTWVADRCEDDDHHDRNEDEDKGVLHHPLSTLIRTVEYICQSRQRELTAANDRGLHGIS
jgi:hypothetical protein